MSEGSLIYPATSKQLLAALEVVQQRSDQFPPPPKEPVEDVRFAMAIRDWCDPIALMPRMSDDEKLDLLDRLLEECSVRWEGEASLWRLLDDPRSRALRSRSPQDVADAVGSGPSTDPVTTALRCLYVQPPATLSNLGLEALRTLLAAQSWTEGHALYPIGAADLLRHASRASRIEDYRRILKQGFVGRSRELDRLVGFMTGPLDRQRRVEMLQIWGEGGMGKSTLLAKAVTELLQRQPDAVFLHFDFDRSDLDPTRSFTLNLELLEQAESFVPGGGSRFAGQRDDIRSNLSYQRAGRTGGPRPGESDSGPVDLLKSQTTYVAGKRTSPAEMQFAESETGDSASHSATGGAFAWLPGKGRPLILILDTFEQVEAGGEFWVHGIYNWVDQLASVTGAGNVRVLVFGRGEPAASPPLVTGHVEPPIRLKELDQGEGEALLAADGVADPALARQLRETFGGNPLVLRLVADLIARSNKEELDDIVAAARSGKLPPHLVQGLLYDRILKHMPAIAAPYAHPGLALPEITPAIIRSVLGRRGMPASEAREVFEALASASWLVRRAPDRVAITQRQDVRRLTLQLIESDPARRQQVAEVRERAIAYHRRFHGSRHRALLLYHQLMTAEGPEDLAFLEGRDLSRLMTYLRSHIEDLPEFARNALLAQAAERLGPDDALRTLNHDAWSRYLAGDQHDPGVGDRLVQSADPMIALDLWRRRPVGVPEKPATFLIQALAETAEWESREIALIDLLERIDRDKSPEGVKRFYWLSRLWLVSERAPLPPPAAIEMGRLLDTTRSRESLSSLASLASFAEARVPDLELLPERLLRLRRATNDPRIFLLPVLRGIARMRLNTPVAKIAVLQLDWAKRLFRDARSALDPQNPAYTHKAIERAQLMLMELHGAPWARFSRIRHELNDLLGLSFGYGQDDREAARLLLRGGTSEFYRPARQALLEAFAGQVDDKMEPAEAVFELLSAMRSYFSICPGDFEPDAFADRAVRDPVKWWLALVHFADQARLLPDLLREAARLRDHPKLRHVRDQLVYCDETLCGGQSSSWLASDRMI